jgi:transposase
MKNLTIREFYNKFSSDAICLEHLMNVRYGMSGVCSRCQKQTNYSRVSKQRAYACQWCGNHVYPCVGTPFENSRTSLQMWFYAIYLFTTTRSGVSAKELQRQLGVTYKCAWRIAHQIRLHMSFVDGDNKLDGIVQIDETYFGGVRKGKRGRGAENKSIIFGMLEKDGDIIAEVVDNVKKATLQPIIQENVEIGTEIHTDELLSYKGLDMKGYSHNTVEHGIGEYVKDGCHVNSLEGFWSHFKKSTSGTHIQISKKHLMKYIKEFEYRYNSRQAPHLMFDELISSFVKPSKKEGS